MLVVQVVGFVWWDVLVCCGDLFVCLIEIGGVVLFEQWYLVGQDYVVVEYEWYFVVVFGDLVYLVDGVVEQ